MLAVTEMGGVVHPPVPAFYTASESVADIVDHCVARVLDCFGLEVPDMRRWGESGLDAGSGAGSGGDEAAAEGRAVWPAARPATPRHRGGAYSSG